MPNSFVWGMVKCSILRMKVGYKSEISTSLALEGLTF